MRVKRGAEIQSTHGTTATLIIACALTSTCFQTPNYGSSEISTVSGNTGSERAIALYGASTLHVKIKDSPS